MRGGGELFAKLVKFGGIDVADRPEIEPFVGPVADVKAVDFAAGSPHARRRMARDEQIDDMVAAPIDQRGGGLAVDVVEPAADQREALRGQVDHRRRNVELAVEPRLDVVLVAGFTSVRWPGCSERKCAETTSLAIF